jgi:hypothetical protein
MPSLHKALNELSSYPTALQQCFDHNLIRETFTKCCWEILVSDHIDPHEA